MTLLFIDPHKDYLDSYLKAVEEGMDLNPPRAEFIEKITTDFDGWLHEQLNPKKGYVTLTSGAVTKLVPQTNRWLVNRDGAEFLGRVAIRHKLNDALKQDGGHIGYSVRPTARRKGYGKKLMAEGLRVAKSFKIKKALVTCNDDNIGSRKIIEGAGGILDKKDHHMGILKRYYWVIT